MKKLIICFIVLAIVGLGLSGCNQRLRTETYAEELKVSGTFLGNWADFSDSLL